MRGQGAAEDAPEEPFPAARRRVGGGLGIVEPVEAIEDRSVLRGDPHRSDLPPAGVFERVERGLGALQALPVGLAGGVPERDQQRGGLALPFLPERQDVETPHERRGDARDHIGGEGQFAQVDLHVRRFL